VGRAAGLQGENVDRVSRWQAMLLIGYSEQRCINLQWVTHWYSYFVNKLKQTSVIQLLLAQEMYVLHGNPVQICLWILLSLVYISWTRRTVYYRNWIFYGVACVWEFFFLHIKAKIDFGGVHPAHSSRVGMKFHEILFWKFVTIFQFCFAKFFNNVT
jgi:hypothetical protein